MGKYTREDIERLAQDMRNAASEGRPYAMLTGAGLSKSAGIPLAGGLVKLINEKFRHHLKDLTEEDRKDYGTCMSKITPTERKTLLNPFLSEPKVNWAHIALACLMKAGFVGRVLTFNFDSILARACGLVGLYPAIYDFGTEPPKTFDHLVLPSIVHLHGQGSGLRMLNNTRETEIHAQALAPLFADTLQNFDVLTLGYSGNADGAFAKIKEAFAGQRRLYWADIVEDETAPSNAICGKAPDTSCYLGGADADFFLVHLAQELACFPPSILEKHQRHLLDELEPVVEPPADLFGVTGNILAKKREQLELELKKAPVLLDELNSLMLQGEYESVIQKQAEAGTADEKAIVAWAYISLGNALFNLAGTKQGAEAEGLWREAIGKYQAALAIKPDSHKALNNCAGTIGRLWHLTHEAVLLPQMLDMAERAKKISGKAKYNLACALALSGRASDCREELLACRADGTLPDAAHLMQDPDLQPVRDTDWFKELVGSA